MRYRRVGELTTSPGDHGRSLQSLRAPCHDARQRASYDRPSPECKDRQRMLDQLRRDIKTRLDELLGEADKLRQALAAIGSRESTTTASAPATSSPGRKRSRGRAGSA